MELLYLPTYCPNLNRIEGFWKFLPKKCLFSAFKNAIMDCLSQTYTSYKQELDS
ncbi:MAG: transposase [Candidatus Poribacteria bacterium]|nr:transposase [Candidatus Poribacteria bacterium]